MSCATGTPYVRPALVIEQVEDALVAHLKSQVSGNCKVEAFPADPAQYDMGSIDAPLLVHYAGSQYQPARGPANTIQIRRIQFALVLLTRSLRGEGGAYAHLEDIRLGVQGYAFAGAGPAEIVRDQLEAESEGVWRWQIIVGLPIPAVNRERREAAGLFRPMISPAA